MSNKDIDITLQSPPPAGGDLGGFLFVSYSPFRGLGGLSSFLLHHFHHKIGIERGGN